MDTLIVLLSLLVGVPVGLLRDLRSTDRFVVSHISRKTSEMWGTQRFVDREKRGLNAIVGLRPSKTAHVRDGEHGAPVIRVCAASRTRFNEIRMATWGPSIPIWCRLLTSAFLSLLKPT